MQPTFIQKKIVEINGQQVMLDYDLAELHGVQTKRLKKTVRETRVGFQLILCSKSLKKNWRSLRSQIAPLDNGRGKYSKYSPFVFTEHGAAMLSSVLKSEKVIQMNILIIKTFLAMRQFAINYKTLEKKIPSLEKNLTPKSQIFGISLHT